MSKNINQLTVCREDFDSDYDFEEAIKSAVMLLLKTGYIMTVRYDEPKLGIVCFEYDYADPEIGANYPYWLSPYEEVVKCCNEEGTEE